MSMRSRSQDGREAFDLAGLPGRWGDEQSTVGLDVALDVAPGPAGRAGGGSSVDLRLRAAKPAAYDGLATVSLSTAEARHLRDALDAAIAEAER